MGFVAYALQKSFKEELEGLQQQDIITPLDMDETVEWYNSLDPARLNQALIRPVQRAPTLNDIFPKLNNVKYLSPIDTSSSYHQP